MSKRDGLSAIIITRNEEKDLEGCLASLKPVVDEIVLVDSGSTDKTLAIARRFTDQIHHRDFTGYSAQKQFALDQARGPWVLNLDADERLSPALAEEIKSALASAPADTNGFDLRYRNYFCGTRLRFGSGRCESHVRLFRKDKSRYGVQSVHEGIEVEGRIGRLKNPVDHFSYRDIQEYLEKCNHYTSTIARQKHEKGERFHLGHHLRWPWEFLVRYFLKLGFLDGQAGLIYALLSSYYVWLKFVKLRDLEKIKP